MAEKSDRVRLDRNESPYGTTSAVLLAWEQQRTASPRTYGLNRYPDFFQTEMLEALSSYHDLSPLNFTPIAGIGEAGRILAAALLAGGGEVVQPRPIDVPMRMPARAWGGAVRWIPLTDDDGQDLTTIAEAVTGSTRLVHVQNPHDPTGTMFDQAALERLIEDVGLRNPNAYVWVDETYGPYVDPASFPDSFAIIRNDPADSKLIVSRTMSAAHGVAGAPVGYLAAGQRLTEETEGVTNGFFVPDAYGWANPEANVNRMSEEALLALLTSDGDQFVSDVRERNRNNREILFELLREYGFKVTDGSANYLFARSPAPYRDGGLVRALRRRGVIVRGPERWGRRYRGHVRISVGSEADIDRLDDALRDLLGGGSRGHTRGSTHAADAARRISQGSTPAVGDAARRIARSGRALTGAAVGAGLLVARPTLAGRPLRPSSIPVAPRDVRLALGRRDFLKRLGAGAAGAIALGALAGPVRAFPPDDFYDTFDLARMIYHENPVGPSAEALDAVRDVIGRGPTAAARYREEDDGKLVRAILDYNRADRYRSGNRRLGKENVMVLLGSGEGLTLAADTFVGAGTLVGEWPAYRVIRERVWQAGGTVVDVPLIESTWQPDYTALEKALEDHPDAGLVHFNAQNNPTGSVLLRGEFDDFARRVFKHHPGTVILVDESDPEFMEPGISKTMPDFLDYVARGKSLIHLQTFSHIFGLTGLRIGYLMAPRRLIERMTAKRIPRPTNIFARAAALASLRDPDPQIRRSFENCSEGRDYIYEELDKIGVSYARSQGQYVFLDTGRSGTEVWLNLIALGVLTRYGREWGMESWLRVNPGLPDENERFIGALRVALGRPDPGNLPPPPIRPGEPIRIPDVRRLLPRTPEGRAIARDIHSRLRRDLWLEERLPPLVSPYREVSGRQLSDARP